ncbi:hypothetical protein FSP39_014160 [Pinctada imbricata]|uniref:Small ribosomal subunit protein uS15m n=1 Tax=Pinctada imbricata TaxID=66713 RepID=A0AA88Y583_PINIB|nr:hypothetical protein FSP39_014160 [Pinctada imbricata]
MAHAMWKLRQRIMEVCPYSDERELTIARMTLQIRNLKEHRVNTPTDIKARIILNDLINKRKKKLKHLRKRDYESFLWLLRTLQIKYTPAFTPPKESRRAKMRRLVQEEAEAKIQEKFNEIEIRMMEEKEALEEEKKILWQQIEQDIEKYRLDKDLIEYKVEKARRDNVEERKGYVVPPPNTYQYIRYLRRMSSRERTDKYLYNVMLAKKRNRQVAEGTKDGASN